MSTNIFTNTGDCCGKCAGYCWEQGTCTTPGGKNYQEPAALLDGCPAFHNEGKEARQ